MGEFTILIMLLYTAGFDKTIYQCKLMIRLSTNEATEI